MLSLFSIPKSRLDSTLRLLLLSLYEGGEIISGTFVLLLHSQIFATKTFVQFVVGSSSLSTLSGKSELHGSCVSSLVECLGLDVSRLKILTKASIHNSLISSETASNTKFTLLLVFTTNGNFHSASETCLKLLVTDFISEKWYSIVLSDEERRFSTKSIDIKTLSDCCGTPQKAFSVSLDRL